MKAAEGKCFDYVKALFDVQMRNFTLIPGRGFYAYMIGTEVMSLTLFFTWPGCKYGKGTYTWCLDQNKIDITVPHGDLESYNEHRR